MAREKKIGKKKVRHSRKGHKGTTVLPAHMLGKSLHKKTGRIIKLITVQEIQVVPADPLI